MKNKTIKQRRPKYPSDSTKKKTEYARTYYQRNPWARKYKTSKLAASRKNLEHTMTTADFKELWFRDNAVEMKEPTIDRIDRHKGYVIENCRYIERSENCGRDNRGRIVSEAQREAGRRNLLGWNKKQQHV